MSNTQDQGGADYLSRLIKSVSAPSDEPPYYSDGDRDSDAFASTQGERGAIPSGAFASTQGERSSILQGGDILSSLLSDPEILMKLPTVLSTVMPIIEMLGAKKQGDRASSVPSSAAKDPLPPPEGKNESLQDRRQALLTAMRPYLSYERQQAIDYIVKLSRLGDILKTL